MKTTKAILITVALFIIWGAFWYGAMSLYKMNMNYARWGEVVRTLYFVLMMCSTPFTIFVYSVVRKD